jgi:predicted transcriptional regulator of viral defense system
MGKQIHLRKIEELFDKSPTVEHKSIERIVGKSKNGSYAKLLVSNLLKKGKIKKIGKGIYTIHNEVSLAVFSFKPAYLGLQSALSYHNLWEQETIPIIITTRKVRRGIRSFIGSNALVRNIDKAYFFGIEYNREGDFYLPYSNLEKTFIDMVVFNQYIDEDTLKKIIKKVDKRKLKNYLKKYSSNFRNRVMKFLV